MLLSGKEELTDHLKGLVNLSNGSVHLENVDKLRGAPLDILVKNSVLNPNSEIRGHCRHIIKSTAHELGIIPASIQDLYEARGRGENKGYTVSRPEYPGIALRNEPRHISHGKSNRLRRLLYSRSPNRKSGTPSKDLTN